MHMTALAFVALLLFAGGVESAAPKKLDAKKCQALGFTGDAKCSACDSLAEFVKDAALVAECKQCCIPSEEPKYVKVELQVNPARLGMVPEVKHFVEKIASKYSSKILSVKLIEKYNVVSRFKCKKADGTHDMINVEGWKRGSFEEFFAGRVQGGALTA